VTPDAEHTEAVTLTGEYEARLSDRPSDLGDG
jgi:hypothetical protein